MEINEESSPTSSTDSWMFVKSESEVGKDPVGKDELEDSDGISVISESEMLKTHSNDNMEKPIVEEVESSSDEGEEVKEPELLTPPPTPNEELNEKKDKELELHQKVPTTTAREPAHNHGPVLIIAMALIIAILYTNISSLKKEIATTASIYEQRIARLEDENQQLKAQLNELIVQLKSNGEILMPQLNTEKIDEVLLEEKFIERQEEALRQPITKDVWLGGEKEDVVKILDKKFNSLPDYCYHTEESDLFYEYNKENCEIKKRKLEERVDKFHKRAEKVDDIYKPPRDEKYDDYMTQMTDQLVASLSDEIKEIKKSRGKFLKDTDTAQEKVTKEKFNDKKKFERKRKQKENFDEIQEGMKNKRKYRGKEGSGHEWNDKRTAGREEARKKNDKEENWFLKRKNDREIHRLEKIVTPRHD